MVLRLPGPGTKRVASSSFHKTICCDCVATPTSAVVCAVLWCSPGATRLCHLPLVGRTGNADATKRITSWQAGVLRLYPPCATFNKRPQRTALLVMAPRLTCSPILQPRSRRQQLPEQEPGVVQNSTISLSVGTRHHDALWVDLHQHDTLGLLVRRALQTT